MSESLNDVSRHPLATVPQRLKSLPRGPVLAVLLLVLATLLAALFYSSTWRTGDDGRYFIMGVSIAEGAGLTKYYNPLQPPETLTPPLYPALIAAVIRVTENPVVWVKRMGSVLYVAAVLIAGLVLMKQNDSPWAGWLGAAMGLFAVGVVAFATHVMADTLFILLVFLCLWMSRSAQKAPWYALLLGLGCGLAFMARVAGIPLIAAVWLQYALRRQWRSLAIAALGTAMVIGPWGYWKFVYLQLPDPYLIALESQAASRHGMVQWTQFPLLLSGELIRDVPAILLRLIPVHFFYAADKVIPVAAFWRVVAGIVGAVGTAGFVLRWRRWDAVDFFFALTVLMLAVMPGPLRVRYYLFPILPIASFYFFDFSFAVIRWVQARFQRRAAAFGLTFAVLGVFTFSLALNFTAGMVHFIKEAPRRPHAPWAPERFEAFGIDYYDAWARVSEAAGWIQEQTPGDALLLSRKPDHLFLMSGRQGWRYEVPRQVERETVMDAVERFAPERMVLLLEDAFPIVEGTWAYGNNREYVLDHTVRLIPERWRMVFETGEPVTRIWAYVPLEEANPSETTE